MKILVFGGTGLVGGYFVNQALSEGHEIVIISRKSNNRPQLRTTYLNLDLGQKDFCREIDTTGVDCVVYAAYANNGPEDYQRQVTTNAVVSLLEHFALSSLKHFIFIGSMVVFGESINNKTIDEHSEKIAENLYAQNKLDATLTISNSILPFKTTVFHPTGVYNSTSERIAQYKQLLTNHYFSFASMGQGVNCVVHASDVARAILLSLNRSGEQKEEFIVNSEHITYCVWLGVIEKTITPKAIKIPNYFKYLNRGPLRKLLINTQFRTPLKIPNYKLAIYEKKVYFDSSKLQKNLNWLPQFKFNLELLTKKNDV
jgi:nucleoside-diphosphate-sugar epimerase